MRPMRLPSAAALAGVVLACAAAAGGQPASAPAIAGLEWDELTKAIQAIEAAAGADEVMAAYARGCTVNRQSSRLQDAYMRKMLKLGRPDVAQIPAQELTKLDATNGIAWGVIGYTHAKRGQYLPAFTNTMKAMAHEKDNPSICRNAAQLLVWYEGGKRGTANAELQATVTQLKSPAGGGKAFTEAYRKAKEDYGKLADEKARKKKESDSALAEAKKVEDQYEKLKGDLRSLGKSYESDQRRLYQAERNLANAEDQVRRSPNYNSRQSAERRAESVRRQIRDIRRDMKRRVDDAKKLKDQEDDLQKQYKAKRSEADRLLREAHAVEEGVPSSFTWQPPAVDGVVTPDATLAPAATTVGKTTPKTSYLVPDPPAAKDPPQPSLAERVAEAEAADKLSLAKICLNSKTEAMKTKGKQLIEEILARYPNTQAATEARELLKQPE